MRKNEYEWVKQNWKELLKFCGEINKADCYNAWLGSFVLLKTKTPLTPKADIQHMNLEQIVQRFEQVEYVNDVFKELGELLDQPMSEKFLGEVKMKSFYWHQRNYWLMHTIIHEY